MIKISLMLSLVASVYLVGSIVFSANRKSGYSHASQTISELAEFGTDHTRPVSLLVFLPVGILLGAVAWFLRSVHPPIAVLALSISVGYGLSAIFPCDAGSPMTGSVRQAMHNLGGGIEYVGGAFSLLWISETAGPGFQVAGITVAASAILLSFESRFRGIIQRIAETCLFAGLVAALWLK